MQLYLHHRISEPSWVVVHGSWMHKQMFGTIPLWIKAKFNMPNIGVAHVQRRGDRPPTLNVFVSGKYGETRSSCLFISGKK